MLNKEGLNSMNNGNKTHLSFTTRTEKAIDVTIVTPNLQSEMEWYVYHVLCGNKHFPTATRKLNPNLSATRRPT
jgi:hypothetical protein